MQIRCRSGSSKRGMLLQLIIVREGVVEERIIQSGEGVKRPVLGQS